MICRNVGSNFNFYHFDQQGSTLFLTGGTGLVTDTYVYDAWGNMVSQTGSTLQPFKYVGRYGYYAHYQDDAVMPYPVVTGSSSSGIPGNTALSFIQTGVRTYFPRLGRYMQVDPARHGINWVMYCGDNPINYIDPEGEATRFIATLSKGAKIRCTDWDKKIARVILGTAISGGAGSVAILAGAQPATVAGTVVVAFVVSLLAEFCPNPIYVWQRTCSGTFDIIYYDVQPTSDPANSYPRPTGKIDKNSKRSIVQTKFQKSRPSEKPYPSAHDFIPSEGL